MSELRKCKIKMKGKPDQIGLFHIWTMEENGDAWALVEFSDGGMERVYYGYVFFINDLWVTEGIVKSTSNSYVQMSFNVPVECVNVTADVVKWDDDEGENSYEVSIKKVTVDHCEYELLLDNCDDLKIDQLAIKQHLES